MAISDDELGLALHLLLRTSAGFYVGFAGMLEIGQLENLSCWVESKDSSGRVLWEKDDISMQEAIEHFLRIRRERQIGYDIEADLIAEQEPRRRFIAAELAFNRQGTPEYFRRLGKMLVELHKKYAWIATISCLDDLLNGKCPEAFSKSYHNGTEFVNIWDPILVWGWVDAINEQRIHPIAILSEVVPTDLATVQWPDNGL